MEEKMLFKVTCEVACAIPILKLDGEEKYKAFFDTLKLMCQSSRKIKFNLYKNGIIKPRIEFAEEITCKNMESYTARTVRKYEYLLISFQVKVQEETLLIMDNMGHTYNSEESIYLQWHIIKEDITKCINDMFFVINFISLGKIDSGGFVVYCNKFSNEQKIINKFQYWGIEEAAKFAIKTQWPKFEELDFCKTWNWLNKREWFITSFGGGNTGRAVLGLMNSLKIEDTPAQLFWALLAIEALYTRGRGELGEQVKEKSQILLGNIENHKKIINQMYGYRSRFIHGDIDFVGVNFINDATDYFEKYDENLREAVDCARAILIASLHQIIKRNWEGISFSYKVFDSGE